MLFLLSAFVPLSLCRCLFYLPYVGQLYKSPGNRSYTYCMLYTSRYERVQVDTPLFLLDDQPFQKHFSGKREYIIHSRRHPCIAPQ